MRKIVTQPAVSSEGAVVWAIDPFSKETRPDPLMVRRLMHWVRSLGLELQPVHVLSLFNNMPESMVERGGGGKYLAAAEKASEKYLRELGVSWAKPVQVLVEESSSRRNGALAVLDYAEKLRSPCVVVSSHGRSGLQKLALGSFAENLLVESKKPLMFLTHHHGHLRPEEEAEGGKTIRRALFATDFSDYSREAFLQFLKKAKTLGLQLTLFHSVSLPAATLASGYGDPMMLPEDYFPNQVNWTRGEAERWKTLAESHGVPTRFIVKDEGIGSHAAESILSAAQEEKAGLIVMASVSGAVSSLLLGSVAREVFRANQFPVWIYGPKALRRNASASQAEHPASA